MKKLFLKLSVLVMVLTLVTLPLVSGTYAKYTKEVTATDTIRVALFEFDVNDTDAGLLDTATATDTFDIFTMAEDTGIIGDGAANEVIAPGTTGEVPIEVNNTGEVDVKADFVISETNTDFVPVYYTIGANTQRYSAVLTGVYDAVTPASYKTLANLSTALAIASLEDTDGTSTQILHWTWDFEAVGAAVQQSDAIDTALGIDGTPEITLSIEVTVTQLNVNP
ncbi:MAG: hypothetical protein LLG09_01865 [Negativicutes bacterium]|nr:hypothetical protein [Negativicutes bacterium]